MCTWGDEVPLDVPIPAHLSHTGHFHWGRKGVDRCMVPLVQALNNARIYTANCCCGHGKEPGQIILHDGQILTILPEIARSQGCSEAIGEGCITKPKGMV